MLADTVDTSMSGEFEVNFLGEEFLFMKDVLFNTPSDDGIEEAFVLKDYGQSSTSWISFLSGMKSSKVYEDRIHHFLVYHQVSTDSDNSLTIESSLLQYFDKSSHSNAGTTLRSWFAMIKKFYLYTGRGKLEELLPILLDNIKKWEKLQSTKQASVFTKENFLSYLNLFARFK